MNSYSLQTQQPSENQGNPIASPDALAAARQKSLILVVDDYAPNIMVASMMLENFGFDTVVAESGARAISILQNNVTPFAAILMDVQMHDMDGFETTRRIRETEKEKGIHTVIIGVTAHALAGDRERCIAAGMDDYMSKPIHPDLLKMKLACFIEPDAA